MHRAVFVGAYGQLRAYVLALDHKGGLGGGAGHDGFGIGVAVVEFDLAEVATLYGIRPLLGRLAPPLQRNGEKRKGRSAAEVCTNEVRKTGETACAARGETP